MSRFTSILMCALVGVMSSVGGLAQSYDGEVTGTLTGAVHKYNGEFTDDLWGAGGFASLQYAPIDVLQIEARFGLGKVRWKVSPNDIAANPNYFGQGAEIGDPYPGTLTLIEPENESRLTTIDLLVNYVLVDDIPAVPFITAGVGWVSFSPVTAENHDALPNNAAGVYSGSTFSIPLGGGVRIPFSPRVGLLLRGEYRFVFTEYLDDFSLDGANDAVTSVSLGLTYSFTNPPRRVRSHHGHHDHHGYGDDACGCCGMMQGHDPECPCAGGSKTPMQQRDGSGAPSAPTDDQRPTDGSATGAAAGGAAAGGAGATTAPADDAPVEEEPEQQPQQRTAVPANIEPCPPGMARVCVDTDKSVCVDTNFTPGRARIKWEDALIYDPGNPGHLKRVKEVGGDAPCYANIIRETSSAFYQCIDCCLERNDMGGYVMYDPMGEVRIVKGEGVFTPEECPDCKTVAAEGR